LQIDEGRPQVVRDNVDEGLHLLRLLVELNGLARQVGIDAAQIFLGGAQIVGGLRQRPRRAPGLDSASR